uniref:Uncharacterized protein n=1 Tax=viral metagenome TaxID=1070528 RepID=A0A6H1ZB99_9ZZZZ
MALTRDAIITEVMNETKRTDKQTRLEAIFPDILYRMSRAVTQDGEPIPLQDLKTDGSLSIVDGNYFVALPSDFVFQYGEPELLYDTDKGRILTKKSLEWMNYVYPNRANNTSNKSKPIYYCLEKNRFDFAPMSDASYTITFPYTKIHGTVDDNTDTILFRDTFKDVIKDWLKAQLFDELDDWDKRDGYLMSGLNTLMSLAKVDKRNAEAVLITDFNDF